ncbi:hypothetical protein ACP26L_08020 [Paenibacillus sp. S-38]|uniref:hypothetical protein n=1 Tax=Paenibacillus sp. S-38 TaxID=3416710 RepID=UPI003CF8EF74
MTLYYSFLVLIGMISVIATLKVAGSTQNTEENDNYTKQTKANLLRLSYLNILSLGIWVIYMAIYLIVS